VGMSISYLWYLSKKGLLKPNSRILDIGTSYLHNLTPDDASAFARLYGGAEISAEVAEDLARRSRPMVGKQMLYVSELLEHTSIQYVSYDVCPGHKTQLFDLNRENLADEVKGSFDLVLNFGTSEHVINQLNVFKIIHEALKVDGIAFHQSPSIGWVNHGYFCYHPRFYDDLQIANGYEKLDQFYAQTTHCSPPDIDFRDEERPLEPGSGSGAPVSLPCCNLNAVYRKLEDTPFRISLELSTSHTRLPQEVSALHMLDPIVHEASSAELLSTLFKRAATKFGIRV
jgi:hypothetical protein